jgi:hypothetical protein
MFQTFCAFSKAGTDYALYSPHYTGTRLMELPSCRDLGGEDPSPDGFCPVEYFVPIDPDSGDALDVGFVAGCVWGDDTSWKIQALDLSGAPDGKVARDARFGYVELPDKVGLPDAISVNPCHPAAECAGFYVELKAVLRFELGTGKPIMSYDV